MFKKTILIDLDGVLNTYTGNFDEKYIPPIKDGAYEFVKILSNEYKFLPQETDFWLQNGYSKII